MSEIRVDKIVSSSGSNIEIVGGLDLSQGVAGMSIPMGTTSERHSSPTPGMLRWNTTEELLEVWIGSEWKTVVSAVPDVGTQTSPAQNGMEIFNAGLPSGVYWINPGGVGNYQMYVDNSRNGGGWVLCARVTTASCQAHMTNSAVGLSGTTGPRTSNSTTTKMADSWIQSLRNNSSYTGSTAYWMEATGFGKSVFIDSAATVNLVNSANEQNARTRISNTFEGGLSDRDPNTGTRGFGDHHTSGGTYFAWGRHPESGNNCGFREDALGASDGYLWVK
jgi:hypothetical protein